MPRYNQFRRLFHKEPVTIVRGAHATTRTWAEEIRRVYNNDLEKVDLHGRA